MRLNYNSKLKKVTFHELEFTELSTEEIKPVFYDNQNSPEPDTGGFKDMLLDVFGEKLGVNVLKALLLLTPKQPKYDGFGFLYLANKTILPIKIKASSNYQNWYAILTKGSKFFGGGVMDWLYVYAKNQYGSEGMSHEYNGVSYTFEDQDLYQHTGKYLYENAPLKFNLKKVASEKRNYLKKYLKPSSPNSKELIDANQYANALSVFKNKLNPPIENAQTYTEKFLEETGIIFPLELMMIYNIANGSSSELVKNYKLLNSEQVLEAWSSWKTIYDEWLLSELKVHYSDKNQTLPMYTTPYWIPFMTDGNGNYVGIDLVPGKKGVQGQIIVFGADEELIKVLSISMVEFLESLQQQTNPLSLHLDE